MLKCQQILVDLAVGFPEYNALEKNVNVPPTKNKKNKMCEPIWGDWFTGTKTKNGREISINFNNNKTHTKTNRNEVKWNGMMSNVRFASLIPLFRMNCRSSFYVQLTTRRTVYVHIQCDDFNIATTYIA